GPRGQGAGGLVDRHRNAQSLRPRADRLALTETRTPGRARAPRGDPAGRPGGGLVRGVGDHGRGRPAAGQAVSRRGPGARGRHGVHEPAGRARARAGCGRTSTASVRNSSLAEALASDGMPGEDSGVRQVMTAAALDEATRVTLEAWLVTDVGVVRDHNEDSAFMEPSQGFFIVADGMGGHAAGEVASAMAVETVRKTLEGAKADI